MKADLLNPAQKKATEHNEGPLLVVAGAGTGKTRVIVERIANLIEKGVKPTSILALTFTEKAAAEMVDRLNNFRGGYTLDVTIATFNGFGDQLLKDFAFEIGFGNLKLLGEIGKLVYLRDHFDHFQLEYFAPVSQPDSQLKLLSDYVSLLKQHVVSPSEYHAAVSKLPTDTEEAKLEKQKHTELANFYETYINLCKKDNVIDYDDQLFLAVEMLKKRPNILAKLQRQYPHILVDEFQDTNAVQSQLIDLLTGDNQNLMVVGDDDQSIYGWRGATVENILSFKDRYPKAKEITLTDNYRSVQPILDSAYRLIQFNNPNRLEVALNLDKHLVAAKGNGHMPIIKHFSDPNSELNFIAETIKSMLDKGDKPEGVAVLCRSNQTVKKVHEVFEMHGIDHVAAGLGSSLYRQSSVASLIEVLKAVNNPNDSTSLYHAIGGPLFSVDRLELSELSLQAKARHESLANLINESDLKELKSALSTINSWREKSHDLTVGNLAYLIITESGWKDRLYNRSHEALFGEQLQALSQFFVTLKEYESIADMPSLHTYIDSLATLKAADNEVFDYSMDVSDSKVNVLSIHRAKGLEWNTVFIVDCVEGSFPSRNHTTSLQIPEELRPKNKADENINEERRLMYVALTRARESLYLTYSTGKKTGRPKRPSRFLSELAGNEIVVENADDKSADDNLELFSPTVESAEVKLPEKFRTSNGLLSLSASQVVCYLKCPQDFYYKYVLGVPEPINAGAAYGTIMHNVIKAIFDTRKNNSPLSRDYIIDYVKNSLPSTGYLSKRTQQRSESQAIKTASLLFDRFSKEDLPKLYEKAFRVEFKDIGLVLNGRFDAVYEKDGKIEIKDFKTGTSVSNEKRAKSRATSSQQLSLYALAWFSLEGEMPNILSLDFVETGQIGTVKKQERTLESLKSKLAEIVKAMSSGHYPTGNDHSRCSHPIDN